MNAVSAAYDTIGGRVSAVQAKPTAHPVLAVRIVAEKIRRESGYFASRTRGIFLPSAARILSRIWDASIVVKGTSHRSH
jgi:hypothetical protein